MRTDLELALSLFAKDAVIVNVIGDTIESAQLPRFLELDMWLNQIVCFGAGDGRAQPRDLDQVHHGAVLRTYRCRAGPLRVHGRCA